MDRSRADCYAVGGWRPSSAGACLFFLLKGQYINMLVEKIKKIYQQNVNKQ